MTGSLHRQPQPTCSTPVAPDGGGGGGDRAVQAAADALTAEEAVAQGTAHAAAGVSGSSASAGRMREAAAGRPHSTSVGGTPARDGEGGGSGGTSPAPASSGDGGGPSAAALPHVLRADQVAFCIVSVAQLAVWLSQLKRTETLSQKVQPLIVLALELAGLGASLLWPLRYWYHR